MIMKEKTIFPREEKSKLVIAPKANWITPRREEPNVLPSLSHSKFLIAELSPSPIFSPNFKKLKVVTKV